MPCGCQAACGCDVQAGDGVRVRRMGDRFIVESTNAVIELVAGDGVTIDQDELTYTINAIAPPSVLEVVHGYYDFAVDGGAVGEIPLRDSDDNDLTLPEGAIIFSTIVRFTEAILPDELDPNAGGAEIKFEGGTMQLAFFQGPEASSGDEVAGNPNGIARSFTPGGTRLMMDIFSEITAGALEAIFLVIPAP